MKTLTLTEALVLLLMTWTVMFAVAGIVNYFSETPPTCNDYTVAQYETNSVPVRCVPYVGNR